MRAVLNTPIASTLLPRKLNCILSWRARAIIEQRRADIRTRSGRNCQSCVQRHARGYARLRHMQGFLPHDQATRAFVQQIIPRCLIGEACDEVIYSEQ